jgi:hypothetical protein
VAVVVVIVVVVVKLFLAPTKTNSVEPLYTAVTATRQTCLLPHGDQLLVCSLSALHLHIGSKEIFGRERPLTNAHHHNFLYPFAFFLSDFQFLL